MSGTVPPIPPPFGASSGNPGSPNVNRVDTMPTTTDPINTTTTTNVAQSVVDENLPQLLDSRGGSHVTNVPAFDKEDFTSWKVRFLVFLDGLEPYLLKTLEDGPFVPMSSLSTTENPLPKRQNQWSNAESRLANQDKRLKSIIISCLPNDVMKSVIKCKTAKEMWNDLILAHEGPSDTKDTKIAALRLKFNAFKSLEGEKVMGTFRRMKCLLNDLENNGVTIPQAEVNATFVNSLPRKWLSMNQTQRANNFIKNDSLATLYGKYNYEEGLIDQIYESETQRFSIQASSSKALISNTPFQDSDSDVEEDQRTNNEFMADLNAEYHERALLENQKRFYKRSGRVGSARKPIDKTKETCFACGKTRHFQKDCPSNKTSTPSYPSSNNSFNKFKSYTPPINQTSSHNTGNYQKDYKGKYKGLKAEMAVLTQRIDDLTKGKSEKGKSDKGKSEKGLIAESFDWDEESVSSEDEGTTRIRAFMAIAEDEPSMGKADARSGQWVDITMKKVHRLLSMTDSDDRKHILDYTYVDLIYAEDQRKNMVNKYNILKRQKLSLNKVIEKWTCSKVTLDQLLSEQIPGNIVKALGGKGRRKENNPEEETPPPTPLPKLTGADLSGASKSLISLSDLTANMAILTLNTASKEIKKSSNKVSQTYVIKKRTESKHPAVQNSCPDKNALPSTEQLLLTLMEEVKGIKKQILIPSDTSLSVSQACSLKTPKQKVWYGPCKHCGMRNYLFYDCYSKPKCSTCGSISHTTKEHTEQIAVTKSLNKLKGQSTSKSTPVRTARMSKTFGECKYYGSNKHHPDDCEFYPGCEICGSIAHEIADCPKNLRNNRKQRIAIKQSEPTKNGCSRHMTGVKQYLHRYSKEPGLKVVFGDDSSGDTEGYGSVNCNGITFTRVAYVNGLKHNLISISQLCDANFKVLFTKTQGTIFNQNDEVVLLCLQGYGCFIIDMFLSKGKQCLWKTFCDEKGILHNFSSPCTPEQNGVAERRNRTLIKAARTMLNSAKLPKQFWGEAVNTACYTQNRSIIVKRHRKTAYDVFRGIAPDINYFHVFGCSIHIHNHRDHFGKFDEKVDDGFFLGYSPVAKAFRVFNIRRQEMEETIHVTFSEDDEAISQTSIEGDAINFNENRPFPDDEFIEPRTKDTQCSVNIDYFPYVSAYENTTLAVLPTLQNSVTSEEPPEFTTADDITAIHEPDHAELADILESAEPQDNVLSESISDDQPAPVISPSTEVIP
ncbi:retrovirus-related pol polyprotein from transposon TNT 1-94 [Tanacetum coccineum]